MKPEKLVVYAATRNLYRNALVCMNSLRLNGNIDKAVLLSEDLTVSNPHCFPANWEVLALFKQPWFSYDGPNATKRWTYMVLMKAALSKLFPEYDRVLFLDCDTIVEHDISQLWDLDLSGNYYAMVPQTSDGRGGRFSKGADYFNGGVMMCNLEQLRADHMDDELIRVLNTVDFEFCEQDAINKLCEGRILALPGRYNVSNYTVPDTEVYIKHFAANGNWIYGPEFREYDVEVE